MDGPKRPDCADRGLAEVDAKRRILDLHSELERKVYWTDDEGDDRQTYLPVCEACVPKYSHIDRATDLYPCETVRLLALPLAEHEDYRESWRP